METIKRFVSSVVKTVILTMLVVLSLFAVRYAYARWHPDTQIIEKIVKVPVQLSKPSLEELVSQYSREYALPPILVHAVIHIESAGREDVNLSNVLF